MKTLELDQAKTEAFAGKMLDMLNNGSLAIMTSIGHRTKLFDTLSILPPATSEQIAEAAGLNERYVREWLGAMVVGGIVEYDPETQVYQLPAEHAAWLTRAAGADNIARYMQYIPLSAGVEEKIIHSFYNGGGVPYSAYPRFHEVMADDSRETVAAALVDQILPLAPKLIDALQKGIEVLDIGCGQGDALNVMAKTFPNSRFTGYDISAEGIAAGQAQAERLGLSNIRFEIKDAAIVRDVEAYDLVTAFDAIHDQAYPDRVLCNIHTALRPDGVFLMQDIAASSHLHNNMDHPLGPFLYTTSTMHCMAVSLAQGGAGLGTVWGREKALEMLAAAGFFDVTVKQLPHDIFNDYYICRRH